MYILFVLFGLASLFSNIEAKSFGGRIINGTNAELGEIPYIVSLRSSGGYHRCGASILNENWILTAAHCVGLTISDTIQHGVIDISFNGSNIIPLDYAIEHEQYDVYTTENDIALLRLAKPIKFDRYTQPVVLPQQDQVFPESSTALLAGWGFNETDGYVVNSLQKVTLETYNYLSCRAIHNRTDILETNICAGVTGGLKGQCSGDSGGPLTVNRVQVGIVSWSRKPCAAYPGVYTRVSAYINWINSKIN